MKARWEDAPVRLIVRRVKTAHDARTVGAEVPAEYVRLLNRNRLSALVPVEKHQHIKLVHQANSIHNPLALIIAVWEVTLQKRYQW